MKFAIFTFFLVFNIVTCIRKPKDELKHMKKKVDVDCKKISCPAIEDPICMKIKNKRSNKTAFIMLLNKCEMEYLKCHKDMEGNTVPMKYCDHTSTSGVKSKALTRRKRDVIKVKAPVKANHKKNRLMRPKGNKDEGKNRNDGKTDRVYIGGVLAPSKNGSMNGNEKIKLTLSQEIAYAGGADQGADADASIMYDSSDAAVVEDRLGEKVKLKKKNEEDNEKGNNGSPDRKKLIKDASSENEDFIGSPEYDDAYIADCPKECPARVRLVCGRCDHGIYKTFLSTCHLRLFNCAQNLEKMKLITRNSCLSSSPLLTGEEGEDLQLEPDGRVYDRDDADPVLAFIRCRNRNSIMVDENGLEIIDAGACKDIGTKLRQDEDYDN